MSRFHDHAYLGTDQYLPDMYYRRGLAVSLPFLTGYLVPRDLRLFEFELYHQILFGVSSV